MKLLSILSKMQEEIGFETKKSNEEDLMHITTKLYQDNEGVVTQKYKYINNVILILVGIVNTELLLKRSAKLVT